MNSVLESLPATLYAPGNYLNVVIACEDRVMARQAGGILDQLERNLSENGRLVYRWWDFEALAMDSWRELASREAAAADLIILGLRAGRTLPAMVDAWLRRLLQLRHHRPGSLVTLLDAGMTTTNTSQEMLSQLKTTAALGQMNFFATQAKAGRRRREGAVPEPRNRPAVRHGFPKRGSLATAGRKLVQSYGL